jgi:hypothetical protein
VFVKQFCGSKGLIVTEDEKLEGKFKKCLNTTIPRQVGDPIAGFFGNYRSRATPNKDGRLNTIHVVGVPGSSVFDCFYRHRVAIRSFWFAL